MHPIQQPAFPLCLLQAPSSVAFSLVAGLSFSIGGTMSKGWRKRNGQTNPTARNEMVATRLAWVLPRPAYGLRANRVVMLAFAGSGVVG